MPDAVPRDLNVLLITVDALRADRLPSYGYTRPTAPEIDRLGAEGTVFTNGWAHAPSTRFSMPAIALSRWPQTIQFDQSIWWPRLPADRRTIGEAFKAMGYVTGAFYAYEYFRRSDARGFERGIDHYDDSLMLRHQNINNDPAHSLGTSGEEMADRAIGFVQANRGGKFFLWLHFYDPHLEYQRHPGIDFGSGQGDLYDAEIRFTDQQIGRLLATLRQLGLYDRTAILLTGDHGEGLGERGIFAHGYHLNAPQTKVPFILRVPGLTPRRVTAPVGHVDIAPTLVNAARGAPVPDFLGRSLIDLAAGAPAAPAPEPVFQNFDYNDGIPTEWRGMASETHHFIWNVKPAGTRECFRVGATDDRDLWDTAEAGPCLALRDQLVRKHQRLELQPIARGVTPSGKAAPPPGVPLAATFGDVVRYLGHDPPEGTPQRGQALTITHHFQVLRAPDPGWRAFFHLNGPGGSYLMLDHVPVSGAYPVERWRPGQVVRDTHNVPFGPTMAAGTYALYVGFWRKADRLPVDPARLTDGQNRLKVAEFVLP